MTKFKKIIAVILLLATVLTLCSCGESSEAKLKRLEKQAAESREKAKQAKDNYNQLKDFFDKYGN